MACSTYLLEQSLATNSYGAELNGRELLVTECKIPTCTDEELLMWL